MKYAYLLMCNYKMQILQHNGEGQRKYSAPILIYSFGFRHLFKLSCVCNIKSNEYVIVMYMYKHFHLKYANCLS